jgi:hypothetical protein
MYNILLLEIWQDGSVMCLAMGLKVEVQFLAENFLFNVMFLNLLRLPRALSLRIKWLECEADRSPPSSVWSLEITRFYLDVCYIILWYDA